MSINNIQIALNTKLNGVSGLPHLVLPNTDYTPVNGTKYVRATLLPAERALETLNDINPHEGIYQIDLYYPLKKGTSALWIMADTIKAAFDADKRLVANSQNVFVQSVNISQAVREEGFWKCYVAVNYLSYY
jgi:hypothetical protein